MIKASTALGISEGYDRNVFDALYEDLEFNIIAAARQGHRSISRPIYCTELINNINQIVNTIQQLGYTCSTTLLIDDKSIAPIKNKFEEQTSRLDKKHIILNINW